MAGHYTIAGKKVATHHLSMFFIGSYAAAIGWAMRPKPQAVTPPIQASSTDEEAFIKEFLKNIEAEEKKN